MLELRDKIAIKTSVMVGDTWVSAFWYQRYTLIQRCICRWTLIDYQPRRGPSHSFPPRSALAMPPQRISSCFHPINAAPHIDTLVRTLVLSAMKITANLQIAGCAPPGPASTTYVLYTTGEALGNRHFNSTLDAIGPDNSYSFIPVYPRGR